MRYIYIARVGCYRSGPIVSGIVIEALFCGWWYPGPGRGARHRDNTPMTWRAAGRAGPDQPAGARRDGPAGGRARGRAKRGGGTSTDGQRDGQRREGEGGGGAES